MKVSLSWLKEYVPVDITVSELSEALTMAGLEVDSVTDRYEWLNTVVVGRIVSVTAHPNADKLTLCDVDIGEKIMRVVCGAPNVRPNMYAPLALPGTEFPDGPVIKKGVIRGEASEGMLCSQIELLLGDDTSGIMELDSSLEPGRALPQALNLSDVTIEIDLTPNRPDCLSLIGVAREVGAFQKKPVICPNIVMPTGQKNIKEFTSVTIESPKHCPRYTASMVENITVGPSPFWLQDRLRSVGLRPINNIVDITNFVMMETGQPLHAFDFDQLAQNRIVVRTASEGEKFTTLDEKSRVLASDILMICDGEKPVGVAGVMGGLNSEIETTTTRVLIESAYFDPSSIRKTAKRLMGTDASHRFERGVDPDGTLTALNRAAQLMAELGGGNLINGIIDERPIIVENTPIHLSAAKTNYHLGTDLSRDQIAQLLKSVEFEVEKLDDDQLKVLAPSFRVDVFRPQDLMEEVARLWGYNNIPVTFPAMPAQGAHMARSIEIRNRIKDLMVGFGFAETINYSFISDLSCDALRLKPEDDRRRMLKILNPLTEDQAVMRTTLIPGLLETMGRNLSRQNKNLKLFEIAKTFLSNGQDQQPDEIEMISALWTGASQKTAWFGQETMCDFYDLKGVVEGLLTGLGIFNPVFTAIQEPTYTRPGYGATILINDEPAGIIGQVHPKVLSGYDLKQDAFVFEINVEKISAMIVDVKQAGPIPKFPPVARDITLIVDKILETDELMRSVQAMKEPLLEDILLFAVYEGENIPSGKKSVSFRLVYRSLEGTLEDETVTPIHQKISQMLLEKFKADFPG